MELCRLWRFFHNGGPPHTTGHPPGGSEHFYTHWDYQYQGAQHPLHFLPQRLVLRDYLQRPVSQTLSFDKVQLFFKERRVCLHHSNFLLYFGTICLTLVRISFKLQLEHVLGVVLCLNARVVNTLLYLFDAINVVGHCRGDHLVH